MSPTLKAIDTEYKGRLFRSRTEARWAIFFDELGLEWEYEVEGFELPSGTRYLPDFKVTRKHGGFSWVEVKPRITKTEPKFEEFRKVWEEERAVLWRLPPEEWPDLSGLADEVVLVSGTPLEFLESGGNVCPRCGILFPNEDCQEDILCHTCDAETPGGGGHPLEYDGITSIPYRPHKGGIVLSDFWLSAFRGRLGDAARKAQKARFEHGARP